MSRYLVTSALPYANGKLHIGHIAGAYIPADIYVRYLKSKGEDVIYICGTDEHGAPISIRAEAEGKSPQEVVDFYHDSILRSFEGLSIEFDNFSGTARPKHHELSQKFFKELMDNGYINTHSTQQCYCEHDQRFLPDRYVEGVCPHCGADGARGDQCDACGKLVDATKLIHPKCKICGNPPIVSETKHWFLDLPKFSDQLKTWLSSKTNWKDNVVKFILSWIEEGLIERSITRDINWGVKLPIEGAEGKVLYVWFDAPIGYISSTIEWAERIGQPELWKEYWMNPDTKLVHFIGKDNIPFHAIIWPALLMGQNEPYVLPYDIPANEYLTLEGEKISTSRDWAIWVEDFLKIYDGELLRYTVAANAPESKDADFSWKEFQNKVNNELANILGNLVNRVLSFSKKNFDEKIPYVSELSELSSKALEEVYVLVKEIEESYTEFKVRKAIKLCMDIARIGNRYFDESKPWQSIKENKDACKESIYVCAEILKILSIVLSPVIPQSMNKMRAMMSLDDHLNWASIPNRLNSELAIGEVKPLFPKIEDQEIEKQIMILRDKAKKKEEELNAQKEVELEAFLPEIEFEDFQKVDIRVVKVLSSEKIKKSDKLLKLKVEVGTEERQVVAGIAQHYSAEELIGKEVVMLFNLKPRQLMKETSQGMILAAKYGDSLSLLVPEKKIKSGTKIS